MSSNPNSLSIKIQNISNFSQYLLNSSNVVLDSRLLSASSCSSKAILTISLFFLNISGNSNSKKWSPAPLNHKSTLFFLNVSGYF